MNLFIDWMSNELWENTFFKHLSSLCIYGFNLSHDLKWLQDLVKLEKTCVVKPLMNLLQKYFRYVWYPRDFFLNFRLAIHYTAKSDEILDLKLLVKSIKKNEFLPVRLS